MSIARIAEKLTLNTSSGAASISGEGANLTYDNTDSTLISTATNWSLLGSITPSWAMCLDGSNNGSNVVKYVTTNPYTGNMFVSGDYNKSFLVYNSNSSNNVTGITPPITSGGSFGAFGMKLSNNTVPQWVIAIDGGGQDICKGQAVDSNENFYVTGIFSNAPPILYNASGLSTAAVSSNIAAPSGIMQSSAQAGFTVKYDKNGTAQWASYIAGLCNVVITSTTIDAQSNLYIAGQYDTVNPVLYDGLGGSYVGNVTTYAGSGAYSSTDGYGTFASFMYPRGITCDTNSNVYISEYTGLKLRKIDSNGYVSLVAGGAAAPGDGIGASAGFANLASISIDSNGVVLVCDGGAGAIKKVYPTTCNVVTVCSGFNRPRGICVDTSNICYVADTDNNLIQKLSFSTSNSASATVFAGSTQGSNDGAGTLAQFYSPIGMCTDQYNNLYVADYNNHKIRKITPSGLVTTYAGTGVMGNINGPSNTACFNFPNGVASDFYGNIYVSEAGNGQLRVINSNGVVSTYCGGGLSGYSDGVFKNALFNTPYQICFNSNKSALFLADQINNRIRKITPQMFPLTSGDQTTIGQSIATTFAGTGTAGSNNGASNLATFNTPIDIAMDNAENLYITDSANHLIRKITPAGVVSLFAGSNTAGFVNGTGTQVAFNNPRKIVIDSASNLFVADYSNHAIRKITPNGTVTTFAGGQAGNADNYGTLASFSNPIGLAIDKSDTLYVCDRYNFKIRKISSNGQVVTIAGNGISAYTDGQGTLASFAGPLDVVCRPDGGLFVADCNNTIRSISPSSYVTTYAGNTNTTWVQDGIGTCASFNTPENIYLDNSGFLYVSDKNYNRIRRISPTGMVTTILGNGTQATTNGTGTTISFSLPHGLSMSPSSNIMYVCEAGGQCIRKITNFNKLGLQVPSASNKTGFVAIYDNTGAGKKTICISGCNCDVTVNTVAVDVNSNIYLVGQYTGKNVTNGLPTVITTPINYGSNFTFPASSSSGAYKSGFILKCLPNTSPVWIAKIDNSDCDNVIGSIAIDPQMNIYATGQYTSATTVPNFYDANSNKISLALPNASGINSQTSYVVKYNAAGTPQWASLINGVGNNQINKISVAPNGKIYIAGTSTQSNASFYNGDASLASKAPAYTTVPRQLSCYNSIIGGNLNKWYDYLTMYQRYPTGTYFYVKYNNQLYRLRINPAESWQLRSTDFEITPDNGISWIGASNTEFPINTGYGNPTSVDEVVYLAPSTLSAGSLTITNITSNTATVSWSGSNYAYAQVKWTNLANMATSASNMLSSPFLYKTQSYTLTNLISKSNIVNVVPFSYTGISGPPTIGYFTTN